MTTDETLPSDIDEIDIARLNYVLFENYGIPAVAYRPAAGGRAKGPSFMFMYSDDVAKQ